MENQLLVNRLDFKCALPDPLLERARSSTSKKPAFWKAFSLNYFKPRLLVNVNILLAHWNAAGGYSKCNTYVRAHNPK